MPLKALLVHVNNVQPRATASSLSLIGVPKSHSMPCGSTPGEVCRKPEFLPAYRGRLVTTHQGRMLAGPSVKAQTVSLPSGWPESALGLLG